MRQIAIVASAALTISLALPAPASAQNARSFVSGLGSDANACSRTTPCRTFQRAHDVTNANGEIDVIDPAGYGPITITKAISIQGHGFSGISVSSNINAITINAGANDAVFLNGLLIDGSGVGLAGVQLNSGGALTIVNCVARNFASYGVYVIPSSGATSVVISDTIVSENQSDGMFFFAGGSATIKAAISRTSTNKNGGVGIYLISVSATIVDSIASNNGYGFATGGTAVVRLSRSTASGNGTGVFVGSSVYSYGDNNIDGNTSIDVSGTLTKINPH